MSNFSGLTIISQLFYYCCLVVSLRWPMGPNQLRFQSLDQSSIYATSWGNIVGLFIVQGTRQFGGSGLVTVKFYDLLKKSMRGSVLNKLAQCCLISCPHDCRMSCQVKS